MKNLTFLLIFCISFISFSLNSQTEIYWGNQVTDIIHSANIDGTNIQNIGTSDFMEGMAYNPDDDMIYWMEGGGAAQGIYKMNTDGTNNTVVIPGLMSSDGLALDLCNGKIYYAFNNVSINRADLDGSNIEVVVNTPSSPEGIAIDVQNERVYYALGGSDEIRRVNFDGTGDQVVLDATDGIDFPIKMAKDMSSGQLYFVEFFNGNINRVDGDGSNLTTLFNTGGTSGDIIADIANNYLYVAVNSTGIIRANLDGTGPITLINDPGQIFGMAINGNANACNQAPIPTMGEWGVILLCILFLIVGIVGIRQSRFGIA